MGRGTIVHCDAEQDVLILYSPLSHKKFIPDAPYWHCVSSQELLKLKSGSQTITHRWKREISIDCFPFTKKEKWAEVLVQRKMGKMSWGLHLVLLVMERHLLFFSSLWGIFPMKHHCGGMENRVKKTTNRDETYHWQENMFLRVLWGKSIIWLLWKSKAVLSVYQPLKKSDSMSKFPHILFRCICFLFIKSFGK